MKMGIKILGHSIENNELKSLGYSMINDGMESIMFTIPIDDKKCWGKTN